MVNKATLLQSLTCENKTLGMYVYVWRIFFMYICESVVVGLFSSDSFFGGVTVSEWSRSVVSGSVNPWTVAYQAPPAMGFTRQEYWSGLPFPSPEDLPNPGIKPRSPALQADALRSEPPRKPLLPNYITVDHLWLVVSGSIANCWSGVFVFRETISLAFWITLTFKENWNMF